LGRAGIEYSSENGSVYIVDSEFLANGDLIIFENSVELKKEPESIPRLVRISLFKEMQNALDSIGQKYTIMTEEEMSKNESYKELLTDKGNQKQWIEIFLRTEDDSSSQILCPNCRSANLVVKDEVQKDKVRFDRYIFCPQCKVSNVATKLIDKGINDNQARENLFDMFLKRGKWQEDSGNS